MEKILKCVSLPSSGKHTIGFNLKGEYLKKYGFVEGDYVKVEITEKKIVITKNEGTEILTKMKLANPSLNELIQEFDLTVK
jgi:hypothetical protein